jgi:glycosyltransferase involved in cell wall biosynthesis
VGSAQRRGAHDGRGPPGRLGHQSGVDKCREIVVARGCDAGERDVSSARCALRRCERSAPVDDVARLLRACDLFAFASRDEACPVAVLEAMSTGLAVVTSDIAGTRHLVTDGQEGLRFPTGDIGRLAAALDDLASNPGRRARLGAAARAPAEHDFTLEHEVEQYQDLYAEVLAP